MALLKKHLAIISFLMIFLSDKGYTQCNVSASTCSLGSSNPFPFVSPGPMVSTCLDFFGPNYGYIMLYITQSGPLNLLIDGSASSGFLDVAVFNVPNGVAPCTAIQNTANQIACNYASASSGCNQFGSAFPCSSSVPSPNVTAGQTIMIVVENWSGTSSYFTLQMANISGSAQAGTPNATINPVSPICATAAPIQVTATNMGGTWSGPGISASGLFNPSVSGQGTHTINYTIGTAPCISSASTTITVTAATVATTTPATQTICSGSATSIALSASITGTTYSWTIAQSGVNGATADSGNNISQTLNNSGTAAGTVIYTITPTANGCQGAVISDTVTVKPVPVATATPAIATICSGSATNIALSSSVTGTTYSWAVTQNDITGAAAGNGNSIIQTLNSSSTATGIAVYTITPIANGCPGVAIKDTVTVHPKVKPAFATIPDFCSGTPAPVLPLTSINGITGYWNPAIVNNTATGTYIFTPDPVLCADTASLTVSVNASITPLFAAIPAICSGTPAPVLPLTSTNGISGSWNPATVNNTATGTYIFTPDPGLCTNGTSSLMVTVNPIPVLTVTPSSQNFCSGTATGLALSANLAGTTYSWTVTQNGVSGASAGSGNNITQILNNNGITMGTAIYTIAPIANGCYGAVAIDTVTVKPVPVATATPANLSICSGASATIALSANLTGTTYSWTVVQNTVTGASAGSGNSILQALTNNTTTSGTAVYTITPTTNGCPGIPVIVTITVIPIPTLIITPATQTLCSGNTTSITLSAAQTSISYSWTVSQAGVSGAIAANGTNITQVLTATGTTPGVATYTITPTIGSCTGAMGTTIITINPKPVLSVTPTSQTICSATAINITLAADVTGTTYAWTVLQSGVTDASAGNGNNIAQSLTNAGTTVGTANYTIIPTAYSCAGTLAVVVINVNPKPIMTATPVSQSLCSGSATAINLSANVTGTTYSWTASQSGTAGAVAGNGNTIAQTLTAIAPVTGTATYTITPAAGSCNGISATVTVTVNTTPAAPGTISGPDTPCAGSTQTYSISSITGASSYIWSLPAGWTGTSTTNSITVTVGSTNGNITVNSANTCGSSAAATKALISLPIFTPAIVISHNAPALLCSGTLVTYTANISNGGSIPVYQWKRNGNNVGINNSAYSYAPADGDTITCVLTSVYPCLATNNITSNQIILPVSPSITPALDLHVTDNHVCSNTLVTFNVIPIQGGATPVYQWKRNNLNVGTNSVTYSYLPFDGDVINCEMTSSATCAIPATVSGNGIPMSVVTVTHPALSITASPGTNAVNGQQITFTAQAIEGGDIPQITWFRNGIFIVGAAGTTWTGIAGTDLFNGTQIQARLQSFASCAIPDVDWSNIIVMGVGATGIAEAAMPDNFRAYPNPSHGIISFEGLNRGDQLTVLDVTGRLLLKDKVVQDGIYKMDISRFAQGVYFFYFNNIKDKRWQIKVAKD